MAPMSPVATNKWSAWVPASSGTSRKTTIFSSMRMPSLPLRTVPRANVTIFAGCIISNPVDSMSDQTTSCQTPTIDRQRMDVDIVCVGFGPATGGFLTTLSRELMNADNTTKLESSVMPGAPPQIICYERADDIGFSVSGVVTRARGIRKTFPDLDPSQIPMCAPVRHEKVLYLLDPIGTSRRSATLRTVDTPIRAFKSFLPVESGAFELPYIPPYL